MRQCFSVACYKSICKTLLAVHSTLAPKSVHNVVASICSSSVAKRRGISSIHPHDMDNRLGLVKTLVVIGLVLLIVCVDDSEAGTHYKKKKKVVIHVPIHKKIEKHVHTIVKHVHHHHKPIVIKEEKIIKEEHHPIIKKEHISHDHTHHHHEKHEHHEIVEKEDVEEEHIHHHHNYEHKHTTDGDSR